MEHASLLWKGVSPLRKGLSNKILIIKPDYATLRRMEEERAGAGERQVLQQCETGAADGVVVTQRSRVLSSGGYGSVIRCLLGALL